MRTPRLYLGTMTFGWTSQTSSKVDENVATEMLRTFVKAKQQQVEQTMPNSDAPILTTTTKTMQSQQQLHVDTARIYAGGQTEPIVSHAVQQYSTTSSSSSTTIETSRMPHFIVGTKAHPSQPGGLSPTGITAQINASLMAMPNVQQFGEYYLHQPDPDHSLLDSLQCLHEYHERGTISAIGMSNYHASEMERAFALCKEYNLTPPTVYQGLYNPLNRMIERELLPVLQKNNCSFIAYNPLAGGLLSGKYHSHSIETNELEVPSGRFKDNPNYLPRFYTDSNFEAVTIIRKACTDAQISMVEATYRWLMYHSALTEQDGILIGASSIPQLEQNLNVLCGCDNRPTNEPLYLPDSVLDAFTNAWDITNRSGVFPYWRSYSADMPNRNDLDQGASYDAAKKTIR